MRNLYLIRHGKTIANEERRYCGKTDISLSSKGISELLTQKDLYQEISSDSIFITTSLKRTKETLNILFGDVPYFPNSNFDELDFGDFEMHTYEELKENKDYLEWLKDTTHLPTKNGESAAFQKQRVEEEITRIINEYKNSEKDVVIISHGGSIAHMVNAIEHTSFYVYEIQPKPGCAIKYTFYKNQIFKTFIN